MNNRNEIREFLASRRAKLTPEQAGLPDLGGVRRVPGLRRGEVAMLAGMSVEYYTRVERGSLAGVSDSVLEAIARALQLNEAEHEHLFNLARAAGPAARRRRQPAQAIHPSVQLILDGLTGIPAFVQNAHLDIVAANDLARALYSPAFEDPARPVNFARFAFLNSRSERLYADWNMAADTSVALLHAEAGRDPFNKTLSDLIGELSTRSEEFRRRWAQRNVRLHRTGAKTFQHPAVGQLDLHFNGLELTATPGLTMFTYTAEPGSPSEDGLRLLASWAATAAASDPREGAATPEGTALSQGTAQGGTTAVGLHAERVGQPDRNRKA
ncbi:transcriptional regulator with XRE-family HTH domain [Arthrobacter globiformis]|uniref:helix-turn-helix transcriptional regulator n=1 Tax=Arthrobacter globiformis TaxID=1665 RepID=UPI002781CCA5|nr:helix-turn-helix transcriptional regulator [Arthrobacter globiformis]MDQ1059969.1 transcriptional regulator with XRE-family HTH domain [Arthrobacter globiformis]